MTLMNPPEKPSETSPRVHGAPRTSKYISLKSLATMWDCDRTTVRRNLETAGVKAFFLGHGKHGIVRYLARDVEEYERRCREP